MSRFATEHRCWSLLYIRSARLRCRCSFTQFEAKLHASGVFHHIDRYQMTDRSEHVQQSTRVPVVGCKAVLLDVLGPGGEFGHLGYWYALCACV